MSQLIDRIINRLLLELIAVVALTIVAMVIVWGIAIFGSLEQLVLLRQFLLPTSIVIALIARIVIVILY